MVLFSSSKKKSCDYMLIYYLIFSYIRSFLRIIFSFYNWKIYSFLLPLSFYNFFIVLILLLFNFIVFLCFTIYFMVSFILLSVWWFGRYISCFKQQIDSYLIHLALIPHCQFSMAIVPGSEPRVLSENYNLWWLVYVSMWSGYSTQLFYQTLT